MADARFIQKTMLVIHNLVLFQAKYVKRFHEDVLQVQVQEINCSQYLRIVNYMQIEVSVQKTEAKLIFGSESNFSVKIKTIQEDGLKRILANQIIYGKHLYLEFLNYTTHVPCRLTRLCALRDFALYVLSFLTCLTYMSYLGTLHVLVARLIYAPCVLYLRALRSFRMDLQGIKNFKDY